MSPNAMGNANASQITQLEEMKKAIDAKVEVHGRTIDQLMSCTRFAAMVEPRTCDSIIRQGQIWRCSLIQGHAGACSSSNGYAGPQVVAFDDNKKETDLSAIAKAITSLATAQLILAKYSLSELKTQSAILEEALSRAKSPIATATLHRPSLKL